MTKELTIKEIRQAVFNRFNKGLTLRSELITNTKQLRSYGGFKMATDGMDIEILDFRLKQTWEMLYRKFVGTLPGEEYQEGYGCINGVNVFNYFHPWRVFNLDPKVATDEEIKKAYYRLSKIYHPDNRETGDSLVFQRINQMYRSIAAKVG